jgi:hypothetical protein
MATDPKRKRIVLFGGSLRDPLTVYGDTWEWDGKKWRKVSEKGPAPRTHSAMAYDAEAGRIVLHGGRSEDRSTFGDVWTWDGKRWKQIKD